MNELKIERKPYTGKDGKEYQGYYIPADVYGRKVEIGIIPKDGGGYVVLDILFEQAKSGVTLNAMEKTMHDDKTGKDVLYTAYVAQGVDEDGEIMEADVKPKRNSDKTLIAYFMHEAQKKATAKG